MKKRIFGLLLVLCLLVVLCTVGVSAAEVDFTQPVTCQHCNQRVTWLPMTAQLLASWTETNAINYDPSAGTHYYLAEDTITVSKGVLVAAGETLCLHLNGNTLTKETARPITVSGQLNLMDHAANAGIVSGYGDNSSTGCVIRLGTKGAAVNMYGGTVKMLSGSTNKTSFAGNGGCVYMVEGTTFRMYGGVIADGKAATGGNVYISKNSTFTMERGTIQNGQTVATAPASNITVKNQYGANVYVASGGTFTMEDGTITGGTASESGGNIGSYGTVNLNGGTVSAGKGKLGGNLLIVGGTGNIDGAAVTGGEATDRGGNVYMAATTCTFTMTSGTVTGGKSTNNGGNLLLNNGQATISGGTITGGSAGGNGGNISANVGANSETNWLKLTGGTVTDGTAAKNGDNVYVSGTLVLENAPTVEKGNIYFSAKGKLQVAATYAGQANVAFDAAHLPSNIPGGVLTDTLDSCEGAFAGKLYVENDPALPFLYGKAADTKLYVTGAARVAADGKHTWYEDNAVMMAAVDGTEDYLRAAAGDLTLAGDCVVDLSGQNVTVTGTGNVTFFDSANADFKTYGTATVTGAVVSNTVKTAVKGNDYYTVQEGNAYSFHRLSVELTNVSIRPSTAGIYYDGIWGCDEKLASTMVDTFGIAVSLTALPGETFDSALATAYTADQMVSGAPMTGVIIADILETGSDANDTNGRKPVYARAYLKLTDGTVILSDTGAAESLYSVMTRLDTLLTENVKQYRQFRPAAKAFYETWKEDGMGSWELPNISAEDDGVIDLLMIGNSFCFYYVEELEAMARAAGVPIRVCNVYAGGCTLTQHHTWWKNGESNYDFYVTEDGVRTKTEGVGLEWCLSQGDWDVISLQQVSSGMLNKTAEEHLEETTAIRAALYGYLKEQFPAADFYWHQVWSYELGYDRSGYQMDSTEKQQLVAGRNRDFAIGVCEENDVKRINTGEAWQYYRENYVGTNGLTDTLCARLSSNSGKGDGYHDGDWGGGQYLNACVWFEVLTGKDCRDTTYRPSYTYSGSTYTLDETLIDALQDSAHRAVADLRAWEAQQ